MSTNEIKFYEDNEYEFEFTPEGTPFRGRLLTRAAKLVPYTANIDLSGGRSRSGYAGDAARICEMNREDLEIALNSVCTKRNEEVSAAQEVAREKASSSLRENEDEVDKADIEKLIGYSGVLERFTSDAARFSGVVGEAEILKLQTLVACSAQLDLLPNGKPIGANNVLTAEAGRGKNYLCDAVARPLPEEFYLAFESSSAKSLYYAAAEDPTVFKHCWLYPNEAEATDRLVETFRPMLSGGSARHITVNKDESGRNTNQDITIEGPVTLTIPTVRNKLDGQLQTRMLVAELADYEGRVARHSGAVSQLLSPGYSTTDYTGELQVWRAALRSLTGIRRVIVPVEHEDFRFDSDKVSHGARVWTNVLGLMCANAWLEQRNREVRDLGNGEMAVVAAPEDYEVAYEVFESACQRSVVNISDTHRKILSALHRLETRAGKPGGNWNHYFPQKKIAGEAGVAQSTVSANKTFLVKSLKFVRESSEGGLGLVEGAEPSWWEKGDILTGFPYPSQVREWWSTDKGNQAGTADNADTVDEALYTPHIPQNNSDRITADRSSSLPDDSADNVSELHGDRTSGESDRHQGEREFPIGRHGSEAS